MREHVCGKLGETSAKCAGCEAVGHMKQIASLGAQVIMLKAELGLLRKVLDAAQGSLDVRAVNPQARWSRDLQLSPKRQ